jgi:Fic/DOC family N-terminal
MQEALYIESQFAIKFACQIITRYKMRDSDFISKEAGKLVPTLFGQNAFVPAPLPPQINMGAIAFRLAESMGALGELRGACRKLTNPWILIRPLQRLEALTSSAMEGTHTTAD